MFIQNLLLNVRYILKITIHSYSPGISIKLINRIFFTSADFMTIIGGANARHCPCCQCVKFALPNFKYIFSVGFKASYPRSRADTTMEFFLSEGLQNSIFLRLNLIANYTIHSFFISIMMLRGLYFFQFLTSIAHPMFWGFC